MGRSSKRKHRAERLASEGGRELLRNVLGAEPPAALGVLAVAPEELLAGYSKYVTQPLIDLDDGSIQLVDRDPIRGPIKQRLEFCVEATPRVANLMKLVHRLKPLDHKIRVRRRQDLGGAAHVAPPKAPPNPTMAAPPGSGPAADSQRHPRAGAPAVTH